MNYCQIRKIINFAKKAMPLIELGNSDDINLQIWEISETEAFFLAENKGIDISNLNLYRHPQARLQWLASRMLMFRFLGAERYANLDKNERGKLFIKDSDLKISISHSENLVAVAFSNKEFGIDIQKFIDKIPALAAKFIPEELLKNINNDPLFKQISHVHWGIKEALFKADEHGSLDYRKNLYLHWDNQYSKNGQSFEASIKKNDQTSVLKANYREILKDYLFCTVTKS